MLFFFSVVAKIAPLYLNILLGYIAGRRLNVKSDAIARMMFFLINPLIIFNGIVTTKMNGSILFLPVLTFILSCVICLIFYRLSRNVWQDPSKNLVAFSAGSGNTGYFGLSLALMILSDQVEGIYIMAMLGVTLYENTLGYYISAKGAHTSLECLKKLITLPTTYAMVVGLLINYLGIYLPEPFHEFIGHIKGAYTVLGLMLVGLGMSAVSTLKIDFKFIGMTFAAKFLVWPLLIISIVSLDAAFFGVYTPDIHQALIMLSIVPLAANTVVMAYLMEYQADKAASAVLLSFLFALFYVPLMTSFFIK